MLMKQISVFIENRPGRLYEITAALAEGGIDIRALCVADTTDFGILRLIVNDPDRAEKVLHVAGMTASITNVIAIRVADQPGGLSGALKYLLDAGVSVEYAYAFISHSRTDAHVILRVDNNEKAVATLSEAGYQFLTPDKLL